MFFISYKSDEVRLIRAIGDSLAAGGIPFWIDEYSVSHEQQDVFQKIINQGIDNCSYGIIFVSEKYTDSPYCLIEVERLLRKLPIEKILIITFVDPAKFLSLFPELKDQPNSNRIIPLRKDLVSILEIINKETSAGIPIQLKSESITPIEWPVIEAGFKVKLFNLQVDFSSRFVGSKINIQNPLTSRRRQEYHRFVGSDDKNVELLFDYGVYESEYTDAVKNLVARKVDPEKENLDRDRLKEEMENYDSEVLESLDQFFKSHLEYNPVNLREVKELGVHMLTKPARGVDFKHRMYTFSIPSQNRTFRVAKLVFPHPHLQDKVCFTRLIFSYIGDQKIFFNHVWILNKIIDSFSFTTHYDSLEEAMKNASNKFKQED